jgi:hypothetical protein
VIVVTDAWRRAPSILRTPALPPHVIKLYEDIGFDFKVEVVGFDTGDSATRAG